MPDIRASDDERERTIDALRAHAAAGRLDAGELEERIGTALAAKERGELARIVEDLPSEPRRRSAPAPRPAARHRGAAHGCAKHDPRTLLAISVLLIAIWAVTGAGYFWPMWPMLGFAIASAGRLRTGNTRVIGNTSNTQ